MPSTGFYAVMAALLTCDETDIYGFGRSSNPANHYWGRMLEDSMDLAYELHIFPLEKFLYHLATRNLLWDLLPEVIASARDHLWLRL